MSEVEQSLILPSADYVSEEYQQGLIDPSSKQAAVESFIPYFSADTKKTKYLSYRATGFTVNEAAKLANISPKGWPRTVLKRWREADPLFAYWDGPGVVELQKLAGSHFTFAEFTRNMRMVLEKDAKVLWKSLNDEEMSKEENEYLHRIRSQYTPQALESISKVLRGQEGDEKQTMSFTEAVIDLNKGGSVRFRQGSR